MARVPKMARGKIFLAHDFQCRPVFLCFGLFNVSILLRICAHIHISGCLETVYDLSLLPNNTVSETFLHKSGPVLSVDWIFITGAPAGQRVGKYVVFDKTFYNLLFKQEVVAAQLLPHFLP